MDLAEEFLDKCCEVVANKGENDNEGDSIKMNYSFIEDSHSYRVARGKDKQETQFTLKDEKDDKNEKPPNDKNKDDLGAKNEKPPKDRNKDGLGANNEKPLKDKNKDERKFKDYEVNINNHPLMIMAKERRVDLLQHPLCLAITLKKWTLYGRRFYFFNLCFYATFLLFLNLFILSSDSPLDWPERFDCGGKGKESANDTKETGSESASNEEEGGGRTNRLAHLNKYFRVFLLVLNFARVIFFFATQEYKPIWNQLKGFQWKRPTNLPLVFLFDFLVYCLAICVACYHLIWQEGSCLQWQICAVTITLAWINLLLHMRLLYGIGQHTCYFSKILHSISKHIILQINLCIAQTTIYI